MTPSLKIEIQTNFPVSRAVEKAISVEVIMLLSREMSVPSGSVSSSLKSNAELKLADSHAPAAFVDVHSSHLPPQGRVLGHAIAAVVHKHFEVPPGRVYVKFVSSSAKTLSRPSAA